MIGEGSRYPFVLLTPGSIKTAWGEAIKIQGSSLRGFSPLLPGGKTFLTGERFNG